MEGSDKTSEPTQVLPGQSSSQDRFLAELLSTRTSNFDGDNMQKMRLEMLATGPSVEKADKILGNILEVVYYYAHPVDIAVNNTGEVRPAVRVVLIDKDSKAYGFVSEGIARSLATLIFYLGQKPWNPPVKMKITQSSTRKGNRIYNIELA